MFNLLLIFLIFAGVLPGQAHAEALGQDGQESSCQLRGSRQWSARPGCRLLDQAGHVGVQLPAPAGGPPPAGRAARQQGLQLSVGHQELLRLLPPAADPDQHLGRRNKQTFSCVRLPSVPETERKKVSRSNWFQ